MTLSQKRFYDEYLRIHERPYNASFGKDGSLFKRLDGLYGSENVIKMVDFYLRWDDSFVRQSGYSVGVFWCKVQQLLDLCRIKALRQYEPPIRTGNFKEYKKPTGLMPVKSVLANIMGKIK